MPHASQFQLYSERQVIKQMIYETSEWDEDSIEVEKYEEDAGESVLRSEKDIVLSRMNHGIVYTNLDYHNLI